MIIGISGPIGAGKSHLANRLQKYLSERMNIKIIELDDILRELLWPPANKDNINLRKELAWNFKLDINYDGILNRKELTTEIFKTSKNLHTFKQIITPYIKEELMLRISKVENTIIEWTYLEEDGYSNLLTHPLIHVDESISIRIKRLSLQSGFTEEILDRIKYENFLPKQLIVKSNIEINTLLTKLGIEYDQL